jgi:IclR family pca regulon transcriptional regulator
LAGRKKNTGDVEVSAVEDNPLFVGSLQRGFAILEAFGPDAAELGLTEIAQATGFDKSAAQRFAFTLHALGYLEKNPSTRKYRLSLKSLGLSYAYLRANPLIERATPYLADLRRQCRARVDLSLLDDTEIVYAVRLQSRREAFGATLLGRRMPAFCSSGGRAMLSVLDEAEARAIVERSNRRALTPFTLTDPDRIMASIAEARAQGYALSLQECLIGEIVVSAPVVGRNGRPVAAVHIASSLDDHDEAAVREHFAPLARATARLIAGGDTN